jgi:hypothetical protein
VCDDEEDLMRLHTPYHWMGALFNCVWSHAGLQWCSLGM